MFKGKIALLMIILALVMGAQLCFASGVIGLPEGTKMKGLELQADGTYKYWQKGLEDYVYNEWKKIDGKQYYFDEHGIMATGAKEIDGEFYLFNADGSLQKEITEVEWAQHMVRATGTLETNPAGESYHQADNYYQDILDEHNEFVAESIDESIQAKLDEEDRIMLIVDERIDIGTLDTAVNFAAYPLPGYEPTTAKGKAVAKVAKEFKEKYIKPGMNDFEKEMTIIQYICATNEYDYEEYQKILEKKANPASKVKINQDVYTAYGALVNHKSVCAGYADAFSVLCEVSELESARISGPTKEDGDGPHAWNMVKINGDWYLVDTTWEDGNGVGWGSLQNAWINRTIHDFPNHFTAEFDEFEINDEGDTEWRFVKVKSLDVPCTSTKFGPTAVAYYMLQGGIGVSEQTSIDTVLHDKLIQSFIDKYKYDYNYAGKAVSCCTICTQGLSKYLPETIKFSDNSNYFVPYTDTIKLKSYIIKNYNEGKTAIPIVFSTPLNSIWDLNDWTKECGIKNCYMHVRTWSDTTEFFICVKSDGNTISEDVAYETTAQVHEIVIQWGIPENLSFTNETSAAITETSAATTNISIHQDRSPLDGLGTPGIQSGHFLGNDVNKNKSKKAHSDDEEEEEEEIYEEDEE